MLTLKNFMVSLLVTLAVGLSSWSIIISNASRNLVSPIDPKKADAYMTDVVATIFNKDGKPSLKVISPKMIHYPENDSTEINTPHVTVYRQSSNPWLVNADHAKTEDGLKQILFWSHVTIHHAADEDNPVTTMLTDTLTIFPHQEIASTNDAITFIQPDTKIHAIGMLANLHDSTVKLLSQTQGVYDAPTS